MDLFGSYQNVAAVEADSIRQSLARRECGQIISAPTRNRKAINCLYNRYANPNIYDFLLNKNTAA